MCKSYVKHGFLLGENRFFFFFSKDEKTKLGNNTFFQIHPDPFFFGNQSSWRTTERKADSSELRLVLDLVGGEFGGK